MSVALSAEAKREWEAHIKAYQASGLSRASYCQQANILYHQFQYYYRHHYLKLPYCKKSKTTKRVEAKGAKFLPMQLSTTEVCSQQFTLKLPNGICCDLPLSIGRGQLTALIEVLS